MFLEGEINYLLKNPKTIPEILAPAGSIQSLKAAVANGADAVYLGVGEFNARAKAENFTLENLKEWVDYAHFYGVKVYLALNILFSDSELDGAVNTAKAAILCGIDAIILQDLGLAQRLRHETNAVLHASTQMGIHNLEGAIAAEKLGFKRIILSRETLLEDIIKIKKHTNLEVEAFVQGAMCVAFSGNCYFSSIVSGLSGNRGRCMQLCRKKYSLKMAHSSNFNKLKSDKYGHKSDGNKNNTCKNCTNSQGCEDFFNNTDNSGDACKDAGDGYWLSAKDMCRLGALHLLLEAGVSTFKIEGRMRKPSYVAEAVRVYKNALCCSLKNSSPINLSDDHQNLNVCNKDFNDNQQDFNVCNKDFNDNQQYLNDKKPDLYDVNQEFLNFSANIADLDALRSVFNRGNYSLGQLFNPTQNIIYPYVQGHMGKKLGNVKSVSGAIATLSCNLEKGDGVKFLRKCAPFSLDFVQKKPNASSGFLKNSAYNSSSFLKNSAYNSSAFNKSSPDKLCILNDNNLNKSCLNNLDKDFNMPDAYQEVGTALINKSGTTTGFVGDVRTGDEVFLTSSKSLEKTILERVKKIAVDFDVEIVASKPIKVAATAHSYNYYGHSSFLRQEDSPLIKGKDFTPSNNKNFSLANDEELIQSNNKAFALANDKDFTLIKSEEFDKKININMSFSPPQIAKNAPLTPQTIVSAFKKTGDTPFVVNEVKVKCCNSFLSISQLNEIRRSIFKELENLILELNNARFAKLASNANINSNLNTNTSKNFNAITNNNFNFITNTNFSKKTDISSKTPNNPLFMSDIVLDLLHINTNSKIIQIDLCKEGKPPKGIDFRHFDNFDYIIINPLDYSKIDNFFNLIMPNLCKLGNSKPVDNKCNNSEEAFCKIKKKLVLNLPFIARGKDLDILKSSIEFFDIVLANNLYALTLAKHKKIILGYGLNLINSVIKSSKIFPPDYKGRAGENSILFSDLYFYDGSAGKKRVLPPLMTFCHCLNKNYFGDCLMCGSDFSLIDDKGVSYFIKKYKVFYCYSQLMSNSIS